jgi:hypothetical protein
MTQNKDAASPLAPLKVSSGPLGAIRGGAEAAAAAQHKAEPLKVSGAEGSPLARAEQAMREKGYVLKDQTPPPAPREPKVTAGGLSDDAAADLLPQAPAKATDYRFPPEITGGKPMPGEDVIYAGQEFHKLGFPVGLAQQAVAVAYGASARGSLSDELFRLSSNKCVDTIARGIEHAEGAGSEAASEQARRMIAVVDDYVITEVAKVSPQFARAWVDTDVGNNPVFIRNVYVWLRQRGATGRA